MNIKAIAGLIGMLATAPVFGQTIYKCPSTTPGAPPVMQQMPCSAQGGGEAITVKPPKPGDNSIAESTARMKALSGDLNKEWEKQAEIDKAENNRQEALSAEHRKAKAAEDQAAAQRATAAAIWGTGRRY